MLSIKKLVRLNIFFLKCILQTSLQGSNPILNDNDTSNENRNGKGKHSNKKRMGVCCFPSFLEMGSLTLEASFVLPIFLFAMISCMLFGQMIIMEEKMKHGLVQAAMEAAVLEYYKEQKHTKVNTAEIYILQKQYSEMEDMPSAIKISSLNFIGTKIPNDMGELEVHMNYQMSISFPFVGKRQMWIQETVYQKAFTGYEPTAFELGEGYVYVTDFGSVYHKSLSCSHIMLSISGSSQVKELLDGKTSYRPCEKCMKHASGGVSQLYIPKEGDCYHSSLSCSGLTRTIHEISVWEIGGRRPCSRCGN